MALDSRIHELLSLYEQRRAEGLPVSPEELCLPYPELLAELRERIRGLESVDAHLGLSPTSDDGTGDYTPRRGEGSAAPEAPSLPGYEILETLGRGGMGVVYKARQLRLNRLLALKMVLGGAHADQQSLLRFLAEAEAVAQLQDPNIVQVYEFGQHQGLPYFTMEFVTGGTLADMLHGSPVPPQKASRLVEQLAAGSIMPTKKGSCIAT